MILSSFAIEETNEWFNGLVEMVELEKLSLLALHCYGLAMDNNGDLYVSDW